MSIEPVRLPDTDHAKSLTDVLQSKVRILAASPEFGFHGAVVVAFWRPRPANNTSQSPWMERPILGECRVLKDISYTPKVRSVENTGARA